MISNEGWGKHTIQERLRKFKTLPKYNYFIELNKDALKAAETWILSQDPGFFDFMAE